MCKISKILGNPKFKRLKRIKPYEADTPRSEKSAWLFKCSINDSFINGRCFFKTISNSRKLF